MTQGRRFCTACGSPLSPGARFCEECGHPVGAPAPASSPSRGLPLRVIIPFATLPTGVFSEKRVVLVIAQDTLVAIVPPGTIAGQIKKTREALSSALEDAGIAPRDFWEASAALSPVLPRAYLAPRQVPGGLLDQVSFIRSRLGLDQAPWLRYMGMKIPDILAESPESRTIPLQEVCYVRGEDLVEDRAGEDLLVIRLPDREERFFLSEGCYYPARAALIALLKDRDRRGAAPERIVSIVPACFEPGRKDFGFQYVFNLIFSDWRLILAVSPGGEDEVERRWDAYAESVRKRAKQQGVSLEAYAAGADWSDAPWQEFRKRTIPEILDPDGVNFFIPYTCITGIACRPGKKYGITLSLPSHTLTFEADPLFAPGPFRAARDALCGVLSITL